MTEYLNKRIQIIPREKGDGVDTTKLPLNEDLRYHSYKRHKEQILTGLR